MPLPEPIKLHAPLRAVWLAGTRPRPTFSEEQLEAAKREAYQRGAEEATRLLERQMLEQREEMLHLQSRTFSALAQQQAKLAAQLEAILPELVLEAAGRVLAGANIDRDAVLAIARDLLGELGPEREPVDVRLSPRDLELLAGYEEGFREKYPQISFVADPELKPGDCMVRSRFGVIDGRIATKLRALEGMLK